MKDLVLFPQTTITATAPAGWAQIVIQNTGGKLAATLHANAHGLEIGPIRRELVDTSMMAKAAFLGPMLKEGLDHLKLKPYDVPDGLPVKIVVGHQGQNFEHTFRLPLNKNALGSFFEIVDMVRTVNKMAGR